MPPFNPTLSTVAVYTAVVTLALVAVSLALTLILGTFHLAAMIGLESIA